MGRCPVFCAVLLAGARPRDQLGAYLARERTRDDDVCLAPQMDPLAEKIGSLSRL